MDQQRALQTAKVLVSACELVLERYSETFTAEDITNAGLLVNAENIELIEWVQYLVNEVGEGDWLARACFIIVLFHRDLCVARSCNISFPYYTWLYGLVSEPGGFSDLAVGIIASFANEGVSLSVPVENYMSLFSREEWLQSPEFAASLRHLESQTRSINPLYYSTLLSLTPSNLTVWQRGALAARAAANSGRIFSNDHFEMMTARSRAPYLTTRIVFDIEPTREEVDSLTPTMHVSKASIWQESPYGNIAWGSAVAGPTGNIRRAQPRTSVSGRSVQIKARCNNISRWNGPISVDVVSDYGRTFLPASIDDDTRAIRRMMRRMQSGVSNRWECWAAWKQHVQTKYPALYSIAAGRLHANKFLGMVEVLSDARGIPNI